MVSIIGAYSSANSFRLVRLAPNFDLDADLRAATLWFEHERGDERRLIHPDQVREFTRHAVGVRDRDPVLLVLDAQVVQALVDVDHLVEQLLGRPVPVARLRAVGHRLGQQRGARRNGGCILVALREQGHREEIPADGGNERDLTVAEVDHITGDDRVVELDLIVDPRHRLRPEGPHDQQDHTRPDRSLVDAENSLIGRHPVRRRLLVAVRAVAASWATRCRTSQSIRSLRSSLLSPTYVSVCERWTNRTSRWDRHHSTARALSA